MLGLFPLAGAPLAGLLLDLPAPETPLASPGGGLLLTGAGGG
jgi:hypothetical protein